MIGYFMWKRKLSQRGPAYAIALLLSLMPMTGLTQIKVKSGFNLFAPQQDVEIGQQSAIEAEKQLPILRDSRAAEYLNRLGQTLAAQAPGERYPYTFKIVNASDINAFALPGGPVYVNRGTIEAARSEAELAGVIAHEISHVALRHGTNQASKAYLAQAGIGVLGGILGNGSLGSIIGAVGGLGLNTLFLKYSRDAETKADIVGAQIMARAGYNPLDLARFFETLQRESKRNPSSNLNAYRQPNGIYEIAYPDNWRAYPSNDNLGVTFVPEGGAVEAEGQAQIIYGAIVNHYRPIDPRSGRSGRNLRGSGSGRQSASLSEATNDLVNSITQGNPYLRVVGGSGHESRLAGRNGLAVTLAGRSPIYGRDERVTLFTRAMDDGDIFYFLFISPNDEYRDYSRTFELMLRSLRINDAVMHR